MPAGSTPDRGRALLSRAVLAWWAAVNARDPVIDLGNAPTKADADRGKPRPASSFALADEASRLWSLPDGLDVELVSLSENETYRIDAADGRSWALRVHRPGYHGRTAIRSELAWLTALRAEGVVTTPQPIRGRDGDFLQSLPRPNAARRDAVLFEWETGLEPGIDDALHQHFEKLGEIAARMHRHVRRWRRPHWFRRLTWDVETTIGVRPHWGRWQDGIAVDEARRALFGETVEAIRRRLTGYGKGPDRFGLVHSDLRLANLLVDGDQVKILDFDDCGFSWFMYDAAAPVSFFEDRAEVPALIEQWLAGYRRIADLPQADANEIPTFVMLRRLLLVAWIGSHSETDFAREMGAEYTARTSDLCRNYLRRFGE